VLSGSISLEFIIVANLDLSSSLYLSAKISYQQHIIICDCSLISDLGDYLLVQANGHFALIVLIM
jgi:hypothetical protein